MYVGYTRQAPVRHDGRRSELERSHHFCTTVSKAWILDLVAPPAAAASSAGAAASAAAAGVLNRTVDGRLVMIGEAGGLKESCCQCFCCCCRGAHTPHAPLLPLLLLLVLVLVLARASPVEMEVVRCTNAHVDRDEKSSSTVACSTVACHITFRMLNSSLPPLSVHLYVC